MEKWHLWEKWSNDLKKTMFQVNITFFYVSLFNDYNNIQIKCYRARAKEQ